MTRLTRQVVQVVTEKVLSNGKTVTIDFAMSSRHQAVEYIWKNRAELRNQIMEAAVRYRRKKIIIGCRLTINFCIHYQRIKVNEISKR